MLRYLYGHELETHARLRASMFRDRAHQFQTRLRWQVTVDANGEERDPYDAMNPLYVIWQRTDGLHGGSMRLMPTLERCMVNDHFGHLTGGGRIESPLIWECTRFCLARGAGSTTAAALMLAGAEIMKGFAVQHFVGVFDARMVRIYRMIGASPEIIGADGIGRHRISVGLWSFAQQTRDRLARNAGISGAVSRHWFERAFRGHAGTQKRSHRAA